ncbi:MAG: type II toxin-antitoxin system prevent-host-death family antitoxin [Chloroflexi bacterium]|nr:type II toxin-antitoxin system prevent-host-death family antitoxin [Chloroflexota bacterium]
MLQVGISEFRSNMNAILQKVQAGEIVSLQVRGLEVAKLVPSDIASDLALAKLERLRETAYVGDILSPLDEVWEVLQ